MLTCFLCENDDFYHYNICYRDLMKLCIHHVISFIWSFCINLGLIYCTSGVDLFQYQTIVN